MGDPEAYKNKKVVENYDKARFEDLSWRKKYFDIFERGCVTKWISAGDVLDVGCGTSRFGFLSNYTGADFSDPMLQRAREKYPGNRYVKADARELPFDDNSFDNVISTRLLMHLEDWEKALEEMYRVCKPDGRIIFDIKPRGVMSVLLRWRQKEISSDKLDMNIVNMSYFDDFNVIDQANFPKLVPMTKFLVIQKED